MKYYLWILINDIVNLILAMATCLLYRGALLIKKSKLLIIKQSIHNI